MQAVVIREVGAFELADVPVPEPGAGEALIRVSVTGPGGGFRNGA